MSIREFTIGFSRTVNLGGYESARVEASVTYQLNSGGSHADFVAAQQELKELLEATWDAQRETIKGRKETG